MKVVVVTNKNHSMVLLEGVGPSSEIYGWFWCSVCRGSPSPLEGSHCPPETVALRKGVHFFPHISSFFFPSFERIFWISFVFEAVTNRFYNIIMTFDHLPIWWAWDDGPDVIDNSLFIFIIFLKEKPGTVIKSLILNYRNKEKFFSALKPVSYRDQAKRYKSWFHPLIAFSPILKALVSHAHYATFLADLLLSITFTHKKFQFGWHWVVGQ